MNQVEPKVYLLAEPRLYEGAVVEWLTDIGVKDPQATLDRMSESSDAEKIVELSGRRCYKSFEPGLNPNVTKIRTDSAEYIANILSSEHGSVLEHANFTMVFEFVSRIFTHELVRHRAGAAYSQESLRYVRLTELGFWTPDDIAQVPEANKLFQETVEYLEAAQKRLEEIFSEQLKGDFGTKKKLTSSFRRIAPEGLATGIVATFNARAFRHIAKMRTDPAAEVEIRLAIDKACHLIFPRHPYLFQDFEPSTVDGIRQWTPKYKKI